MTLRYMALSAFFSILRQFEYSETGNSGSKCMYVITKSLNHHSSLEI